MDRFVNYKITSIKQYKIARPTHKHPTQYFVACYRGTWNKKNPWPGTSPRESQNETFGTQKRLVISSVVHGNRAQSGKDCAQSCVCKSAAGDPNAFSHASHRNVVD